MNLIRLFILVFCIILVSGCAGFGDSRRCGIRGKAFEGLFPLVKDSANTTKVLMVHGVGKHIPGYSTQFLKGLAEEMGLNHISEKEKNISLNHPTAPGKEFGNLRVRRLTNEDKSHKLVFYELTWSKLNDERKAILAYDMSGDYSFDRAFVNEKIKRVTNDFIPDQMLYVGEARKDIIISFKQAFCAMVSRKWDDLPITSTQTCSASDLLGAVDVMQNEHYAFISHSLGSRIVIDGLQSIAATMEALRSTIEKAQREGVKLSDGEGNEGKVDIQEFIKTFRQLRVPVFMLANQLPLFQVTREIPEITGQRKAYCRVDGEHYNLRTLSETDIIAFSDPNDILSYTITNDFMRRYIDSRICYQTTNININVAEIGGIFGITYANPLAAHSGYHTDKRVLALIANGVGNENTSPIVDENCKIMLTN